MIKELVELEEESENLLNESFDIQNILQILKYAMEFRNEEEGNLSPFVYLTEILSDMLDEHSEKIDKHNLRISKLVN